MLKSEAVLADYMPISSDMHKFTPDNNNEILIFCLFSSGFRYFTDLSFMRK